MTKIIYKKRYNALPDEEGAIILKEICGVGADDVQITLPDLPGGYIVIGDIKMKVSGGALNINLSSLADGLYTPLYIIGTRVLLCSPFIKRGDVLIRPLPDGADISRLELIISRQEERIDELQSELAVLKSKIESSNTLSI